MMTVVDSSQTSYGTASTWETEKNVDYSLLSQEEIRGLRKNMSYIDILVN